MKKIFALALALIMALSMSAMAFAGVEDITPPAADEADTTTTTAAAKEEKTTLGTFNECPVCSADFRDEAQFNAHLAVCRAKTCTKCGEVFANESDYNNHVQNCTVGDTKDYVDLTIHDILDMIIQIATASMDQWGDIEGIIEKLIDLIQNIGTAAVPEADVNGAIAELEGLQIPGISDLLDQLKAKVKALYAGEKATTVVETTAAAPADTGSASVGIAVFAAVSVAAAAAYVCTKKD